MKFGDKISNFLFIALFSTSVLSGEDSNRSTPVQYVVPQLETTPVEKGGGLLMLYSQLNATVRSYEATSKKCSNAYKASQSEQQIIQSVRKLKSDMEACYKTSTGKLLTQEILGRKDLDVGGLNNLAQLVEMNSAGGTNPNSYQAMQMCARNIEVVTIPRMAIQSLSGYPSDGWCKKLMD